jgi:N-acyl-D-aspartate/D-glutamate deacylase
MGTSLYDLVITNGLCVTASDVASLDIAVSDGKIALLAPSGSLEGKGAREIDAEGGYVMVSTFHTDHGIPVLTSFKAWRCRLPCPSPGTTFVWKRHISRHL